MRLNCLVNSPQGQHSFSFTVHRAISPSEFHLHPDDFYQRWGKSIPQGLHYEIEIIEPGEEFFVEHKLHIQRSRLTNRPFVCFPNHIPTVAMATMLIHAWALGSVATVVHGVDLNTIITNCDGDISKVEDWVKAQYEIWAPTLTPIETQ